MKTTDGLLKLKKSELLQEIANTYIWSPEEQKEWVSQRSEESYNECIYFILDDANTLFTGEEMSTEQFIYINKVVSILKMKF